MVQCGQKVVEEEFQTMIVSVVALQQIELEMTILLRFVQLGAEVVLEGVIGIIEQYIEYNMS